MWWFDEYAVKSIIEDAKENPEIPAETFGQMLMLQCRKNTIGDIMRIEYFAECVRRGSFIDYDGFGYYLSYDGETEVEIGHLDADTILTMKDQYPFIRWCNK